MRIRMLHQLADRLKQRQYFFVMPVEFILQQLELCLQFFVCGKYFAKFHKCTHYLDAGSGSYFAVENAGQHHCTMFGKNKRRFSFATPSWCRNLRYQVFVFPGCQLKHEIFWESVPVSFHLFVQSCRGYSIDNTRSASVITLWLRMR